MKLALIAVNILLGCFLVFQFFSTMKHAAPSAQKITVKARKNKKSAAPEKTVPETAGPVPEKMKDPGAEIAKINIFNQERCPNAGTFGGNAQLNMTLVGTFVIGNVSGAIILQKAQNRPMFPMPGMMPGMPPGGDMFDQRQRRQGGFQQNQGGRNGERSSFGSPMGNRPMMGGRRGGMLQMSGYNVSANTGAKTSYKQYVRVGETMANGYKLLEVSRTKAILLRGSEKLELELADASANQAQARTNNNRKGNNNTQTQMLNAIQNMQRVQMMQNMNMMRMMNQNGGGPGGPGGRGGPGR